MRRILLIVVVLLPCSQARADLIYTLGFDKSLYIGDPGTQVTFEIILTETATDGDANLIGPGTGLATANNRVMWDAGGSKVLADTDINFGAGFLGTGRNALATEANMEQLSFLGVEGSKSGNVVTVSLGTYTFTLSSELNTTTTITASDFDPTRDDLVLRNGMVIERIEDFVADSSFTRLDATIKTVPEPGSLLLMSLCVAGMAVGYRVRSRRKKRAS